MTDVSFGTLPSGQLQVNFQEKLPGRPEHRGFQMALQEDMTHGLVHLLEQAVEASQWREIPARASGGGPDADAATLGMDKPKYRN